MRKGLFACVALFAGPAFPHVPATPAAQSATSELIVGSVLIATFLLYASGIARLWLRTGVGRGINSAHVLAFASGWTALALTLLSPLDRLGGELFSMHMIQHEVMMLIAAPLLASGCASQAFLWAFPANARARFGHWVSSRGTQRVWHALARPSAAWLLHAIALWVWHAPPFFDAAVTNRWIHDLQHVSFLGTALLFWVALLRTRGHEKQGAGIVYLFTTTVHTTVLGALITFGSRPWYRAYLNTAPEWGLTALEDQQLGGLIMWVPGSLVYVGIALVLLARWIESSDQASTSSRVERPL